MQQSEGGDQVMLRKLGDHIRRSAKTAQALIFVLLGVSGCGKTRAIFDLASKHYTIYFDVPGWLAPHIDCSPLSFFSFVFSPFPLIIISLIVLLASLPATFFPFCFKYTGRLVKRGSHDLLLTIQEINKLISLEPLPERISKEEYNRRSRAEKECKLAMYVCPALSVM